MLPTITSSKRGRAQKMDLLIAITAEQHQHIGEITSSNMMPMYYSMYTHAEGISSVGTVQNHKHMRKPLISSTKITY